MSFTAITGDEKNASIKTSVIRIITSDNEENNKAIADKNYVILDLNSSDENLSKERNYIKYLRKFAIYIFEETNNKKKFGFIRQYNNFLIEYLSFLEENDNETESTKYIYLAKLLFFSYSNMYNVEFKEFLDQDKKKEIEENSKIILSIISVRNSFRIKQLLIYFSDIKNDPKMFYNILIYCMSLLKEKGENLTQKNENYTNFIARNFFEECLIISRKYIENDTTLLQRIKIYLKNMKIFLLNVKNI